MESFVGKYFYINNYGLCEVERETKTMFILDNGLKFKKKTHCEYHYGHGNKYCGKFMTKEDFSELQKSNKKHSLKMKMISQIYDYITRGSKLYNKSFEEIESLYNLLKQMEIIP